MTTTATWKRATDEVRALTDGLGLPVDKHIVPTVTALRLLGYSTIMSCGGHSDRITGGPYVVFISEDAKRIWQNCKSTNDPKSKAYKIAFKRATIAAITERNHLWNLLEEFYDKRSSNYNQRLTLRTVLFTTRLTCTGADQAYICNKEERKKLLAANREEMQTFALFLKDYYFKTRHF